MEYRLISGLIILVITCRNLPALVFMTATAGAQISLAPAHDDVAEPGPKTNFTYQKLTTPTLVN